MTDQAKFFSQQWCDAALEVVNANTAVYDGYKDPETWTNIMEFGTLGNVDVVSHLEFEKGRSELVKSSETVKVSSSVVG